MTEDSSTSQPTPLSGNVTGLPNEESIFGGSNNNGSGKYLQFIQAGYRLNGKHYLKWSQVVQKSLKGKGNLKYLTGTSPPKEDPRLMTPDVNDTCMFLTTAKEIWEFVQQTYSKVKDAAQGYEIRTKALSTKQGNGSLTDYANSLQTSLQELDHYRYVWTTNLADAMVVKKLLEQDRVYDFLAGLNMEEEVPSLNTVISMVWAEKSRRSVMVQSVHEEGSALASTSGRVLQQMQTATNENNRSSSTNNSNLWFTYCKKLRHTKGRCWKLHGKLFTSSKDWGQKGQQQ
ncbi:hypothetical protein ACOSP7_026806 [Xanthoceras sorbifolium]